MNKLLKMIRHNIGLKLLSVLIAIVIWYVVVGYNDPVITKSYSVHINVVNDSYIANGKQSYIIEDEYKSIVVYLKGNRSTLKNITESNIKVEADLTQIVDMDSNPVYVPLTASCPGIDSSNITLARTTVPIVISDIASKEFPVTINMGNSSPGKDYEVGKTTPSMQKLVISGPNAVINSIDSVVATIDVSDMTSSRSVNATLKLIDKNQAEISKSVMQDDLNFEGGYPTISVYVELWKKVSDVRCEVVTEGDPAYGYKIEEIKTVPETITIAGTDSALDELKDNGNVIQIPIDIDNISSDAVEEIDITALLPENTKLSENTSDTVIVNISVLSTGSQTVTMDVDQIEQDNLASGLAVSYDKTEVSIVVNRDEDYAAEEGSELQESDVKVSIDFNGMTEGDYTKELKITLPEGYSLAEAPQITVHIKKAA